MQRKRKGKGGEVIEGIELTSCKHVHRIPCMISSTIRSCVTSAVMNILQISGLKTDDNLKANMKPAIPVSSYFKDTS